MADVGVRPSHRDRLDARWHAASIEQVDRAINGGPMVEVVLWPEDAAEADRLGHLGLPRLLLLDSTVEPADRNDPLEDWARMPCPDADLKVRIHRLRALASQRPPRPHLDGGGRLIYGGRWVALPELDERLLAPMIEAFGDVVSDADLVHAAWPGGGGAESTLRPRITRLRRRIAALGLDVFNVRGRGYLLRPRVALAGAEPRPPGHDHIVLR